MQNDLISRSALITYVKEVPTYDPTDRGFIFKRYPKGLFAPDDIVKSIQNAPAVDAMEVVRCKDCEYRGDVTHCPKCYEEVYEIDEGDGYYDTDYILHDRTHDEGFCDCGKRRADDGR